LYVAGELSLTIDVKHLGREHVIAAHEIDGVIVDPGPASAVETLLEELGGEEPRALLLTHIHLDHAGASGVLVRRFPDLAVYVHERGAPHLIEPSRLLESASRLYGDDMERLWGEVAPVPTRNVYPLEGGETVGDFHVEYTPGHASHHVCYLHEASGEAYVGDMAGVRTPPEEFTLVPTPPPDIDVEAWEDSLDLIASWRPKALYLTHFGRVDDVDEQIARAREALDRQLHWARTYGRDDFVAAFNEQLSAECGEEGAAARAQAASPDQLFMGLDRYIRKRAERARDQAGAGS
jgi:glyoxylase-like metal-dependent hydrolase (beta-lactamase superfamily II)